jgi:hypothetical protein
MTSAGTDALVAARHETHGEFRQTARCAQQLRSLIHSEPGWASLSPVQREALDSIAVKIARILCGDPNFPDHWADIGGYAALILRELPSGRDPRQLELIFPPNPAELNHNLKLYPSVKPTRVGWGVP